MPIIKIQAKVAITQHLTTGDRSSMLFEDFDNWFTWASIAEQILAKPTLQEQLEEYRIQVRARSHFPSEAHLESLDRWLKKHEGWTIELWDCN